MSKCEVSKTHKLGANKKTLHINVLNNILSKLGVNLITIIVYYVLLKCARKQLLEVQIEHLFVYDW